MFESQFDGLEFVVGTGGEVGDGAVFDFALETEGLAEEDPVIGFAPGGGFGAVEVYSVHINSILYRTVKGYIDIISGYTFGAKYSYLVDYLLFATNGRRNFRSRGLKWPTKFRLSHAQPQRKPPRER